MFELASMAKKKLGRKVPEELRSNFDLGEDLSGLKAECEKVGFKNIKIWNQPINMLWRNGKHFVEEFMYSLDPEDKELKEEIVRQYDDLTGANTTDLKTFEISVIVCYRD